MYQRLNKKIEQWNTVFNASVIHREREKQQLIDVLAHKAIQQQNYIIARHTQKKIMPKELIFQFDNCGENKVSLKVNLFNIFY